MGTISSIITENQKLFRYIEKGRNEKIAVMIQKNPKLLQEPMTIDCKVMPLSRAAWRGNVELVRLFINQKAPINHISESGETALIMAAKRNHLEILKILVQHEADVNTVSDIGLQAIQYAILAGFYEIAHYLYPMIKNKQFKNIEIYQALNKKYHYRYVNYSMFIENLVAKVDPDRVENYFKKQIKRLNDPVIDPRQPWKKWISRVIQFEPAPLVERSQLPEELQPQNRTLGKIHHHLDAFVSTSKIKPSIYPETKSEMQESQNKLAKQELKSQIAQSQL